MAFGKRQLVLAALVVALGAAVYLNWQFSGDTQIAPVGTTSVGKELGESTLVNGSADSVTSRPASAASSSTSAASTASSAAGTAVSSTAGTSSTAASGAASETAASASASASDYFTQTRLTRQKTRDEAIELLENTMNDTTATDAVRSQAVDDAAAIAQDMLKESNIENLIKSKGYTDCVVFLQNGECQVVVQKETEFGESDAVAIRDIITSQTDVPYNKIKIVEAQ